MGERTIVALETELGPLPDTLTAYTGGGGRHLIYQHPGGQLRNRASHIWGYGPARGVDIRGDGGYIIAPPSTHPSGRTYQWENRDTPIAALPKWLREPLPATPADRGTVLPFKHADGRGTPYGLEALRKACQDMRDTPSGTRNNTLNAIAYSLGRLIAGGELNETLAVEHLTDAARDTALIDHEIDTTLRSGLTAGKKTPKTAPPRPPDTRPSPPREPEPPDEDDPRGIDPDLETWERQRTSQWAEEVIAELVDTPTGTSQTLVIRTIVRSDTDERSTWWPRLWGDTADPLQPLFLRRADGTCLLYPGTVNAFMGEPESCKTWCSYTALVEAADEDQHCLIIDFEDSEQTALSRLLSLGLDRTKIDAYVHFIRPEEPILDRSGRFTRGHLDLNETLQTYPIALAVLDGVTEGMALEGFDPLDNGDVAKWYGALPRPIATGGAAVLLLDHVTKDKETRGRFAIGAQHKLAGLSGAGYMLSVTEPFAPGKHGKIRIDVSKDRHGQVRRHADAATKQIGVMSLYSDTNGTVSWSLDIPVISDFVPTEIMSKVHAHLAVYPGATKNDLMGLASHKYVPLAVARLVDEGYLTVRREGQTYRHYLTDKPYTEPT